MKWKENALNNPIEEHTGSELDTPGGYEYWKQSVVGSVANGTTPQSAMAAIQAHPSAIFPFKVVGLNGETTIEDGAIYDLQGPRLLLPNVLDTGNFVLVDQKSDVGFRFRTGPGHFDGIDATISFTTFESGGKIILQQHGYAPDAGRFNSAFGPPLAQGFAWMEQASNLRDAIGTQPPAPPLFLGPALSFHF